MSILGSIIDDFVARKLFNLAWGNNYPIHSSVALDSFCRGFLDEGFEVRHFSESDELYFQKKNICSRLTDDILYGHGIFPKGSLMSLSESVEDICCETNWKTYGVRVGGQSSVIRSMGRIESHVQSHMKRFQDNVFLDINRNQADLNSEKLLDSLLTCYSSADLAETFYLGDVLDSSEHLYHRSLQRNFWANYIERLAEIKGYDLKYTLDSKRALIQMQNACLIDGTKLF